MTKPRFIPPMLATLTAERALGDGWVLERKLDGIRCLAVARGGDVRLYTRTEREVTAALAGGRARRSRALGRDVVLDGEVVGMDGRRAARLPALQRGGGSVALWAFDVLHLDGDDLRDRPLHERRAMLDATLAGAGDDAPARPRSGTATASSATRRRAPRAGRG